MKRKEFLRGVGLVGLGSLLPVGKASADSGVSAAKSRSACVLIPSETEGPFPLDLTTTNSATYFRSDLRETQAGVDLHVKMKIFGLSNCAPMTNVRVNIWHCNNLGIYSGYNYNINAGDLNATFLRGYQMTDAYGEVSFLTKFPGHYSGRVTHIHFQVYVSSAYKAVSQFTFDTNLKNALYTANSSTYNGTDTQSITTDNVFSDGYANQLGTLTKNSDGSYSTYFEASIQGSGSGSMGMAHYEGETGGQFKLGQNFPNPHTGLTSIPFTLNAASQVQIDIYDLQARKVATIGKGNLAPGEYIVPVDFEALGIAAGSYLYQIQVSNSNGVFRQVKMMTAAR